ncbi:MAG: YhcN/YlaJ family sporulation lipoprotein [Christensenella sp.]|nr:YhcN/YlaJ family sporulation lipoprotein [Christensenella sp.]
MEYVEIEKTNDLIKSEILGLDSVVDVAELDNGYTMLIALVVNPIYSREEKNKLVKDVENIVYKHSQINEVLITFDADLFYKIKASGKQEKSVEKIIGVAKSRIK